jgi:predicted AAA+ superfamily ATPase
MAPELPHFTRRLDLQLPAGRSAFLWGPRQVGKSTLLRRQFPNSIWYDFLQTDLFLEMNARPSLLREQLLAQPAAKLAQPIILDEVQKVPGVLDEVHWLIENKGLQFILCGSSARKLRRGHVNLLGGRAWRLELFPLVSSEIGDFDLLHVLNNGLIPSHYIEGDATRSLHAYTQDFLKEEVFAEGLTRNVPAFSRFFDAVGHTHGELTNFASIARDSGVDAKTVREYYQILVDTLVGRFVEPYSRRAGRQIISKAPKFYLFDTGVAGALSRRRVETERGEYFGRALEHLVLMELVAHASYSGPLYPVRFWRTKSGLEVDFILGDGEVAIEVKGSSRVERRDLTALRAFVDEHNPRTALVVCNERAQRSADGIQVLPWRIFLERLWAGEIIEK